MLGSMKVSKRDWYDVHGGLENPKCWRRQARGAWQYFVRIAD